MFNTLGWNTLAHVYGGGNYDDGKKKFEIFSAHLADAEPGKPRLDAALKGIDSPK